MNFEDGSAENSGFRFIGSEGIMTIGNGVTVGHNARMGSAIIGDHGTVSMHADQELMKRAVSVLAAHFETGHLVYQKEALDLEWNVLLHFSEGQRTAHVLDGRQGMQRDTTDLSQGEPGIDFGICRFGTLRNAYIPNDLRWVSRYDRVSGDIAGHHGQIAEQSHCSPLS